MQAVGWQAVRWGRDHLPTLDLGRADFDPGLPLRRRLLRGILLGRGWGVGLLPLLITLLGRDAREELTVVILAPDQHHWLVSLEDGLLPFRDLAVAHNHTCKDTDRVQQTRRREKLWAVSPPLRVTSSIASSLL